MKAQITIQMDTPAFIVPNAELELGAILRELAEHIEHGIQARQIEDCNGNRVGTFRITGQPRRFGR